MSKDGDAELLWQAYRGIRVLRDVAHAAAKQKKYAYGLGALQTRSEELLADIEAQHPEFVARTALRGAAPLPSESPRE